MRHQIKKVEAKKELLRKKLKMKEEMDIPNEEDIETDKVIIGRHERLLQALEIKEKTLSSTDDLFDTDDCTICLYIPYERFVSLPSNETKKIQREANLFKTKEGVMHHIAQHYGVGIDVLKQY